MKLKENLVAFLLTILYLAFILLLALFITSIVDNPALQIILIFGIWFVINNVVIDRIIEIIQNKKEK